MRTSWIVIATVAFGSLLGLGLTYIEAVSVGDKFDNSYVDPNAAGSGEAAPKPSLAVITGDSTFDFGTLQKNKQGKCIFTIRNDGEGPLVLDLDGVSCGFCVQTDFKQADVAPGEDFSIKVTYITHKDDPEFAEYLEVRTNDLNNMVLRFEITGYVTQSIRFSRDAVNLGNVAADENASTTFRVYGYTDDPIEITSHEFVNEKSADYFSIELTHLELDQFKDDERRAKSAIQVQLNLSRGKQLGPVKQLLRITAKLGDKSATTEIIINATIVSDISLLGGPNFNKKLGLVQFGSILSTVDHKTTLRIRVRGPYRDDVKLSIASIDPANVIEATIGERIVVGKGFLYTITILIPKGSPTINRLGSQQGKVGVINIETTHPSAKQLPIYVSFAIE